MFLYKIWKRNTIAKKREGKNPPPLSYNTKEEEISIS